MFARLQRASGHNWHRRRIVRVGQVVALLGTVVCTGAVGAPLKADYAGDRDAARPELQEMLDSLVTGPNRIAPGVTTYVSGPHGTWSGSAGVANVKTGEPMLPAARMRLASVSKLWTATLVMRFAQQRKLSLDDTVERWLPGLLPQGRDITLRQLLNHTSGLIDSNDVLHFPNRYLNQVKDPRLHAKLVALAKRLREDPGYEFSPHLWVQFAAAVPLLLPPGSAYHYSSIGYDVAALVVERVGGASLATLFRRQIIGPLHLTSVAYDPHAKIAGLHARGYRVATNGSLTDTTTWTMGVGAGGGVVSNAADEGRFLVSLMRGKLLHPAELAELKKPSKLSNYGLGTGIDKSGCAGIAFGHNGGMDGFESNVFVSGNGNRVAVLLLNGRTADNHGDAMAFDTMNRLYCRA